MGEIDRRKFLAGAAAAGALGAMGVGSQSEASVRHYAPPARLPKPADSGIDHIVVVMMENRSFDHYLGWLPGADGKQGGLSFTDTDGVAHSTHHLKSYAGCGFSDPDHSYGGGRTEFDDGACDGWLRAGANDELCIGYYERDDVDFHGKAAQEWTVCDRYFAAVMSSTFPNRLFQHAAQTDRVGNAITFSELPTIWDRLKDAGLKGRYYFSDVPFTAMWGLRHLDISRPVGDFYADAAAGRLPAVSFVDPGFLGEGDIGMSEDEHPLSDIRLGQRFLGMVHDAVVSGPGWEHTVLVVNYDEWGGFFDHVPPMVGPDPRPDLGTGLRGFRVPCLVISPRARRGAVAHETYDHTSVLKMIEWRFGLPSLTVRDAAARNLAEVLDFTGPPNTHAPRYRIPPVLTLGCLLGGAGTHTHSGDDWAGLAERAVELGFHHDFG